MTSFCYTYPVIRFFTSKTQATGERGENAAVGYLKKAGYTIVERNTNNKYGEIDIVAKKKGIYCLVNKIKDYRVQGIIVLIDDTGVTEIEILDLQ
jgi:Holliday junction resolvase-like predicted endonuclease